MSYKPLSKEQAEEMSRPQLIQDGTYPCVLMEFHHTDKYLNPLKDKNGEPMTRIKLKVWDSEGKEKFVFTNLFWGENNKMSYRTRHFAESFKVIDKYESGDLYGALNECLETNGACEIYTQKARPKNDGTDEMWPAKNDVRDFVEAQALKSVTSKPKEGEFINDDIPF